MVKKKRYLNTYPSVASESESEEPKAPPARKRLRKAHHSSDTDSEPEIVPVVRAKVVIPRVSIREESSSEEEDDSSGMIIQQILCEETHTQEEWDTLVSAMRPTEYIQNGSMFDHVASAAPVTDTSKLHAAKRTHHKGVGCSKRYLIKWKNLSHLHLSWETEEGLNLHVNGSEMKLRLFRKKLLLDEDDFQVTFDDMDAFREIERIIDSHEFSPKSSGKAQVIEYLVKWKGLGYDHCTWEQQVCESFDSSIPLYPTI